MGLFSNLFGSAKPPKPPAPPPTPVPAELPKITAPTAAEVCERYKPQPEAQKLLAPGDTPSQYLTKLQENKMGGESVNFLANGMPDREGVLWASQSAQQVSDKVPPADADAAKTAEVWAQNPTPANQAAAAEAAKKTDFQGPGAWAAQGAAWAQPEVPAAPDAAQAGAMPEQRLTPHAVSGSVLLSAAKAGDVKPPVPEMPQAPAMEAPAFEAPKFEAPKFEAPPMSAPPMSAEEMSKAYEFQQPFIARGLDIASGKTPLS
jgi:hypothetical protein